MKQQESQLVSQYYLDSRGQKYARQMSMPDGFGHKLNAEFFQPFIRSTDIVLDFGCGKGGLGLNVRCRQIDGLDVNPWQLEFARKIYSRTFSKYAEPRESEYDVVMSNHALEHVPAPADVLKCVLGWLKPGGIAVFVVPHDSIRDRHQRNFDRSDLDHHLYTWTPLGLGNLFTEAGFEVIESRLLRSAWHPRLFFLHRLPVFGPLSRTLMSVLLKRLQVLCVARRPKSADSH